MLLARLFALPANVLVLDEPTNDLDIDTLELLEELLQAYDGTVFLVSHDRRFLDNVVTSTIAWEGDVAAPGLWREYEGGYEDWTIASSYGGGSVLNRFTRSAGLSRTRCSRTGGACGDHGPGESAYGWCAQGTRPLRDPRNGLHPRQGPGHGDVRPATTGRRGAVPVSARRPASTAIRCPA